MAPQKKIIFIFLMSTACLAHSQTITVSGNPVFPSIVFNLTEAGNDFTSSVTSTSGSYISISHNNGWSRRFGNFNWRVAVHKSNIVWNSSLTVQVRRSGDGSAGSWFNNYISGGTNFQTVTNVPTTFFQGGAARNNVPAEYKINNISVLIPSDNYEATVYFTVYSQ